MKSVSFVIVLIIGIIAVYFEYSSIHHDSVFNLVPGIKTLLILMGFYLIWGLAKYDNYRQLKAFVPLLTTVLFFCMVFFHQRWRTAMEKSPSLLMAHTRQIGSDGGLSLDFKRNGSLLIIKMDHWDYVTYWGNYKQQKDTLKLAVSLDFKLERTVIIRDSTLEMPGTPIQFDVLSGALPFIK